MSDLMNTKHTELLATQLNVEETHKQNSSKLIEREQIQNTPFWAIGNEKTGYYLVMGKYKITETFPTIKEAKQQLVYKRYDIILIMIGIVFEQLTENN